MKSSIIYSIFMEITIFGLGIIKPNIDATNIIYMVSIVSFVFLGIQVKWAISIDASEQTKNTWLNVGEIIVLVITIIFSFVLYNGSQTLWLQIVSLFSMTIVLDIYLGTIVGTRIMELKDQNYGPGGLWKSKEVKNPIPC